MSSLVHRFFYSNVMTARKRFKRKWETFASVTGSAIVTTLCPRINRQAQRIPNRVAKIRVTIFKWFQWNRSSCYTEKNRYYT